MQELLSKELPEAVVLEPTPGVPLNISPPLYQAWVPGFSIMKTHLLNVYNMLMMKPSEARVSSASFSFIIKERSLRFTFLN